MIKYSILLIISVNILFTSCRFGKNEPVKILLDADVSYISQRLDIRIADSYDKPGTSYDEQRMLLIDGMETILNDRVSYDPTGEAYVVERGAAMGMAACPKIYFSEEMKMYSMELNHARNYIIDRNEHGMDTIQDFVILEHLKIIMSEQNYYLFSEQIKLRKAKRKSIVMTIYRYK